MVVISWVWLQRWILIPVHFIYVRVNIAWVWNDMQMEYTATNTTNLFQRHSIRYIFWQLRHPMFFSHLLTKKNVLIQDIGKRRKRFQKLVDVCSQPDTHAAFSVPDFSWNYFRLLNWTWDLPACNTVKTTMPDLKTETQYIDNFMSEPDLGCFANWRIVSLAVCEFMAKTTQWFSCC